MSDQPALIEVPPIAAIKAVVDVFADLGIDPLHLHADGHKPTDHRPDLRVWCRYRTDFERVCERLRLKAVEKRYAVHGQRHWFAEQDNEDHRLLVECVSFAHHADWEPRSDPRAEEARAELNEEPS